jgi:hypothetical protein
MLGRVTFSFQKTQVLDEKAVGSRRSYLGNYSEFILYATMGSVTLFLAHNPLGRLQAVTQQVKSLS